MKTIIAALALLLGTAASAHAVEKIQPFNCRQVSGPAPKLDFPEFNLRKPAQVLLVCPFTQPLTGYRIRFADFDGFGGNNVVKAHVARYSFATPPIGTPPAVESLLCSFSSNLYPNDRFTAEVPCQIAVGESDYQAFVVELWSRLRHPDVRFIGIETW